MLPIPSGLRRSAHPVLSLSTLATPSATLLARFALAEAEGAAGLRLLAGPRQPECWHSPDRGQYRIEHVRVVGTADMREAAVRGYRELLRRVRGSAQPCLLRIWNYFAGINQGEGDAERYRAFCVGRAEAVDDRFHSPPPAATAIGSVEPAAADQLDIYALCGAEPGIALENPRQTPAWRYPREYGPVAPGFSRGVILGQDGNAVLLASGTASIVGHVSQHAGDAAAQLRESLHNLQALLAEGEARSRSRFSLRRCRSLRVYLRQPEHCVIAQTIIGEQFEEPGVVRYLQGDICRRELEVELEGVFAAE